MRTLFLTMILGIVLADEGLGALNNIVYFKPDSSRQFNIPQNNKDNLQILNTATFDPPSVAVAAVHARTLVERESLVSVNTIHQAGQFKGMPVSFTEYYADCGDGQPIILSTDMSVSFQNFEAGSPVSLSIRVGDHPSDDPVNSKYPGSRPLSVPGSPRINLQGQLVPLSEEEIPKAEECFLKRHKDAEWWTPGNPIRSSQWMKFTVDGAYYIGGFSDTSYIGEIPKDVYKRSGTLNGLNSMGRSDPAMEFWESEISTYHKQLGDHSTLALLSNTLLGRLRRLKVFYEKVSVKKDLNDNDVVTPGFGMHTDLEMYDLITSSLVQAEKKKRSMFKDKTSYESGFKLTELKEEQFKSIIEALQNRIDEVKQYTDEFMATKQITSASNSDSTPSVVIYEEIKSSDASIADYKPHPHDRFHVKELREQGEWSIAKSEDIYLSQHPGELVPDDAKNKLVVFLK